MGRKMDFLIQEVNRESNTIGSKCNDVAIAKVVVGLKAGSGEDAGAGPECGVMQDEAHQHRIWQSGLR